MDDDSLGTTFGFEFNLNETKKQSERVHGLSEALLQEAQPINGDVNGASLENVGSKGEIAVSGTQESQTSDCGYGLSFYPSHGSDGAVSHMYELGDSEILELEQPSFCGESEFSKGNICGKKPFLEKGEGIGVSETQEFEVAFNNHHDYPLQTRSDNDGDGKCPWKIGVIDDNSLVETLEVRDGALKQEICCCADTEKRLQRQVVKAGKNKNSRVDENINNDLNVASIVDENDKGKIIYSRKELEALSSEGSEGQKRRWVAAYSGLETVIQKEIGCCADTEKRLQRQVKAGKNKYSMADEDINIDLNVASIVEENDKGKNIYSRKELEALSNEGLEGQKRTWIAAYSGLETVIQKEIGCCADTEKRLQRQVKDGKNKNSRADEDINIDLNVASIVDENDKGKIIYSRKELEALSNEGLEGQKRRWVAAYSGLGTVIQKEYDGLVQQHQRQQPKKKKNKKMHMTLNVDPEFQNEVATVFFGEESSHAADNGIKNLKTMDTAAGFLPVGAETTGAIRQGNHMEDDYDDGDGDEAYDSIQKPAFVVTGEPDFNSGPPEDGLEYLRRVRWEAAQIPKVKVAKVEASKLNKMQTVYMPQVPDIPQCPAHLMPLKEWECAFLADFSELRLALSYHVVAPETNDSGRMPSSSALLDVKESFNNHFESHMSTNGFGPENCENLKTSVDNTFCSATTVPSGASTSYPTLSVMQRMSSVARAFMLRKHIGMAEKASMLSKEDCMWLFALCAAVDWPVDADTCAALRSLLRKCASLRVVKEELDEEVIMLNILATIAGKHFGQSET